MRTSQVNSLANDLPPLGDPAINMPLYFPNDDNETEITDYSHQSYSTRLSSVTSPSNLSSHNKYSHSFPAYNDHNMPRSHENQAIKSQFSKYQVKFSSLALTILHVNPLDDDNGKSKENDMSSSVDHKEPASITSMSMSEKYFTKCTSEISSNKSFSHIRQGLSEVCCPHDHLRILAMHIHLNCEQKCRKSRVDLQLSASTTTEVSIAKMELTESLFSDRNKMKTLSKMQQEKYRKCNFIDYYILHSELLAFDNKLNPVSNIKSLYQSAVQSNELDSPNIKIKMTQSKQQKASRTSLHVNLTGMLMIDNNIMYGIILYM